MYFKKFIKVILPFLLLFTFANISSAQTMKQVESRKDIPAHVKTTPITPLVTPSLTRFEWIVDKEILFNPLDYSFYVVTEAKLKDDFNNFSSKTYKLNDVDKPPFYGDRCLKADDSWECSKNSIAETIKANIEYPDKALRKNHDGREVVTFTLNEYGVMEGTFKVLSKDKPCKECAQAAVDAVASLKNWYPAMKDGKFVKTEISIPVVFEIIER